MPKREEKKRIFPRAFNGDADGKRVDFELPLPHAYLDPMKSLHRCNGRSTDGGVEEENGRVLSRGLIEPFNGCSPALPSILSTNALNAYLYFGYVVTLEEAMVSTSTRFLFASFWSSQNFLSVRYIVTFFMLR